MAEGAKRAHSDLNININGPTEELDVVTERPRDLSAEVELAQVSNKGLESVMGHLGNIADNANDLNRTINAYDMDVDYKDRAHQMELEQNRLEEAQALDLYNHVSATKVEMLHKVEQAKEAARNSGDGDVLSAAQGVMEEYRDSYSDSFEGSRMWSRVFESEYEQQTRTGINTNYEIQHAKMLHNMSQIQNEVFRSVTMGEMSIDDGMSKLILQTSSIQGHIPYQAYQTAMDECYNQLVIAKALNLGKVATGGNAVEIANSIRDLVNSHGKKVFNCYDNNGQLLKDASGQPVTYTATLTPATVEELLKTAQSYENKASAAGTGGSTKTFEEYKDYVDGADLEEKGVSSYMMSTDSMSAKRDYDTLIQNIQADPNSTPKKKQDQIRKVSEYYYGIVQPAVATFEAMQLTPDSRTNHAKLQQKLIELNAALDSKQNMIDYSITFDMDNGQTFELKPTCDYALMGAADKRQAAHNIWESVRDTMQRTLQAETTSDFLYGTNYHYTEAVKSSLTNLRRTSLLNANGINQVQVSKLTDYLRSVKQAYVDATGASGTYNALPTAFVSDFLSQYSECKTTQDQNNYSRAVATALANSGFTGSILELIPQATTNDDQKAAAANLQKELILSAPGLIGLQNYATFSARLGKGQHTTDSAKKYLSDKNLATSKSTDDVSDLTATITKLMDDHKVPAALRDPMSNVLANVAMDIAVVNDNMSAFSGAEKATLYKGKISDALEAIVSANFVEIDSPYVTSSVHIGNPALLQGQKMSQAKSQAKTIGSMVTEVGDTIHSTLKQMGDHTAKNKISAELDSVSGRIIFKKNNETIGLASELTGIFGAPVSIPYNYMAAKPATHTPYQWQKEVTDFVSVSTALSVLADDKPSDAYHLMGLKSPSKLSDPVTKQKIDKSVTSADAIRMLSVLQRDDFLKNYADIISSGDKIGVSPAPRYLKEMLKQDVLEERTVLTSHVGMTKTVAKTKGTPENINKLLDYAYSKSTAYNKVDITVNKPLSYDMQGLNFTGVISAAHTNGYHINRDYDMTQYGNYISNHAKGMALDFGVYSNNMEDNLTGLAKVSAMENFTNMLTKNPAYAKKVSRVLTSRPELLENKPEYADYAKFRALKTSDGKPLFQDARESDRKYGLNHKNHFHVDFKEQVVDAKGKDFINAFPALATDMVNTSSKSHTPLNNKTAKALLYTFGDRFGQTPNKKGQFGMANLTEAEYSMLGMNKSVLHDPTIQARAMANRFQAYSNALGNTDLAVYALAGATFKNQDNQIMTVQEILNSGKIAGINGQKYFIAAPMRNGKLDAAEQARQNALYRKYKKSLKQ